MDPLSLMAAGTGMGVLLRLADAGAEWCTLRARTRLAETVATLPPGTEMGGSRRSGATWFVRVPLSIAQVQATQADTGEH